MTILYTIKFQKIRLTSAPKEPGSGSTLLLNKKKQMTCPSTARWCSNQIRILSFSRIQIALNKTSNKNLASALVAKGGTFHAETSAIIFPRQHPASSVRPQHAALPGQCLKKCISWKCLESYSSWWLNQPI